MAKAYPSMLALLGLIAVAGYQNRDRIADTVGKLGANAPRRAGLAAKRTEQSRLTPRRSRAPLPRVQAVYCATVLANWWTVSSATGAATLPNPG